MLLHLESSNQHVVEFPFTCIGLRLCAAFIAQLVKEEAAYSISHDVSTIRVEVTGGF